ncbi:hypothetical protein C8R48DRAFT_768094 [Suillus tomentosus]|nr:hypothetical protein C8R48DRAFT_768094 [Suillus tomentosus]
MRYVAVVLAFCASEWLPFVLPYFNSFIVDAQSIPKDVIGDRCFNDLEKSECFSLLLSTAHGRLDPSGTIVIDEAHDILMAADYCHAFKTLLKITNLNVQVALLTGTLSPHSEVALLQALQIDRMCIHKIQMQTHCPEIQYHIRCSDKDTINEDVLSTALSYAL